MSALHITKDNFENEVINSKIPVILDFWAPWCGPCRMIAGSIEELSQELSGKAKVGKINVDEEMELASKFKVISIPTIVAISEGKVIAKSVGAKSKDEIKKMID